MKPVVMTLALLVVFFCAPSVAQTEVTKTGTVVGEVQISKGWRKLRNRSNVVIYLENVPAMDTVQATPTHEVRQRNLSFDPPVSVVARGTQVSFPNEDKVFHNVFSLSQAATFDLGLYRSGSTKKVNFETVGVVDVYCNIHPQMAAKVVVLDTSFFDATGRDGKFEIPNVPPGKYPIVAWQRKGAPFHGEVVVRPGETTTIDISLVEEPGPDETHTQKDGTPYGRYK